jgi:hypothetical protein
LPFALIDNAATPPIPVILVTPDSLASVLSALPEAQRHWAAANGYRVTEAEPTWDRLRDVIRHGWEHMTHRRSRSG